MEGKGNSSGRNSSGMDTTTVKSLAFQPNGVPHPTPATSRSPPANAARCCRVCGASWYCCMLSFSGWVNPPAVFPSLSPACTARWLPNLGNLLYPPACGPSPGLLGPASKGHNTLLAGIAAAAISPHGLPNRTCGRRRALQPCERRQALHAQRVMVCTFGYARRSACRSSVYAARLPSEVGIRRRSAAAGFWSPARRFRAHNARTLDSRICVPWL